MIAVGAVPAMRRQFLATQTLYQFAVASAIGVPLGVIMYNGVRRFDDTTGNDLVVPWTAIGLVRVVLPLVVAALIDGLVGSGTPAVSRRVA